MPNKTLKTVAKRTHTSMKTVKKAEKIAKSEYPRQLESYNWHD